MIKLSPVVVLLVGAIVLWALTRKAKATVTIGDDVWASQGGTTWVPTSPVERAVADALAR